MLLLLVCLAALHTSASGQSQWGRTEDSLYQLNRQNKITTEEWWRGMINEAGCFCVLDNLWAKEKAPITQSLIDRAGLSGVKRAALYIADSGKARNKEYMQLYLFNRGDTCLLIPRKDATISHVATSEYAYLDNHWIRINASMLLPGCGNGYFKTELLSGYYLGLETSSRGLPEAPIPIRYKIVIKLVDQTVESNEIEIRLFPNQVKRIIEEEAK